MVTPMAFLKSSSCSEVVFRGTRNAPYMSNLVTMLAVKPDNLLCSTEERRAGFVFYKDCMTKPTEQIFKEEETIVPSDRNWADDTLVIYTQRFGGKESVDARTSAHGLTIALCKSTGRTVNMGHDSIDYRRGHLTTNTLPG